MASGIHVSSTMEREYAFEAFRFIPSQQLLLYGETPVRLGSRALDILAELVERPGELISKRELIARAWPHSVVEESNLKVHVAALRRALCEGGRESRFIATVSGRGYRFVAPVTYNTHEIAPTPVPAAWEQLRKLPVPVTRTTGRTETIAGLLRVMEQRRIVSIVGPGGIGKSTVALAVSETFIGQSGIDLCFVDLTPVTDARFVAGVVASALGITIHSGDGVQSLVALLQGRRLLLVLDSCEHVIDATAVLVDRIARGASGVQVLATSREPLRVAGEYVHRLAPLVYPVAGTPLTAQQALVFPSVQLFVQRASESRDGYQLTDADAPAVAEICRRLEGMPLAIELAATRMDALGASELATRLDDRFHLLKRGRRSALERHRTLDAALDWSYEFLPEDERSLLRRLALFAGAFTLDAATGLCTDAQTADTAVVDGVANLVDKSLLAADVGGPCVYYRLLGTTKAYALEKLEQRGELEAMRRCHLEFHRALFERAGNEWDTMPAADWLTRYGRCLDDVRSALAWAFAPGGDSALGIALTVEAIPLWTQLSLLEECRQCAERALAAEPAEAPDEMKLRAALGAAILYANGPIAATNVIWTRVLELADGLQSREHQLMALWGMAVYRSCAGELQAVQELSERFRLAAGGASDRSIPVSMERLIGVALHCAGDQPAAQRHLQQMLSHYVAPARTSRLARFQLDQRSAALGTLANVQWLLGYPELASRTVQVALQEARDSQHVPSLMYTIIDAGFPLMVLTGDYAAANELLAELASYLTRHVLVLWENLFSGLQASLQVLRGDVTGLPLLHRAVGRLQEAGYRLRLTSYLGTLAAALGAHGRHHAGLVMIDEALSSCEAGEERWCHAELLRIKGTLLAPADADAAACLYLQALEIATAQGALSWQLRVAISLVRLLPGKRHLLANIYAKFSEGHDTADLCQARALLDQVL